MQQPDAKGSGLVASISSLGKLLSALGAIFTDPRTLKAFGEIEAVANEHDVFTDETGELTP